VVTLTHHARCHLVCALISAEHEQQLQQEEVGIKETTRADQISLYKQILQQQQAATSAVTLAAAVAASVPMSSSIALLPVVPTDTRPPVPALPPSMGVISPDADDMDSSSEEEIIIADSQPASQTELDNDTNMIDADATTISIDAHHAQTHEELPASLSPHLGDE
jgi:hypothetical protein